MPRATCARLVATVVEAGIIFDKSQSWGGRTLGNEVTLLVGVRQVFYLVGWKAVSSMHKRHFSVLSTIASLSVAAVAFSASAEMRQWVAVEDLERFTCPSKECGVVGRFYFRESVSVLETSGEWSRVTPNMAAGCFDGTSTFVESGPDECTEDNGIVQGEYSEWVMSKFLVDEPPSEPMQDSSSKAAED